MEATAADGRGSEGERERERRGRKVRVVVEGGSLFITEPQMDGPVRTEPGGAPVVKAVSRMDVGGTLTGRGKDGVRTGVGTGFKSHL